MTAAFREDDEEERKIKEGRKERKGGRKEGRKEREKRVS